ncbi:MAG: energy transducer TonB [Litorimonas sp.]
MSYRFARIFLTFILAYIPTQALAQQGNLSKAEFHLTEFMQKKLPDFRIVKSIEPFRERYNASVELNVVSTLVTDGRSVKALVTLHDGDTGEPLESCYSPCTLHKESGRHVYIYAYRIGHAPIPLYIDRDPIEEKRAEPYWKGIHKISLGPNFRQIYVKRKKCEIEFADRLKMDADASPCYRSPPHVPHVDFSGECKVTYDLTKMGNPINIVATTCTDPVFEGPTMMAVSSWKYYPKVDRGVAVKREGIESTMRFDITDFDGHLLDANGERVKEE